MNKDNKIKYNLGFSLVEIVVVVSILTILSLGVFTFHNFIIKEETKAKREINIKITMDMIKNTLISDYKFHRGDNPDTVDVNGNLLPIKTNIAPIRLLNIANNRLTTRNNINGQPIGLNVPFPLTRTQITPTNGRANIMIRTRFNTKIFTIQQLALNGNINNPAGGVNGLPNGSRDIYYSMSCENLPNNIANLFPNLTNSLRTANFYNQTRCIQQGSSYTTTLTQGDTNFYTIGNVCNNNQTTVIRRDVFTNGGFSLVDQTWNNGNLQSSQFFPNPASIGTNTILGIAFCMWVPSEEDLITANNTEIELYYYMLDIDSLSNPRGPQLEVRTEKLSLHRHSSISTGLSPINP